MNSIRFGSLFPKHAFQFKGGGGGTQIIQSAPSAPPPAPAAPPRPTPPVTERTIEVEAASRQTLIDARRRKGLRSTLLAGETGGYQPAGTAEDQKRTLLG